MKTSLSAKDEWLDSMLSISQKFGRETFGVDRGLLETFSDLCEHYHVPNWYFDHFFTKGQNQVVVMGRLQQDTQELSAEIPFTRYDINHVKNMDCLIKYMQSVPMIGGDSVVLNEEQQELHGSKFYMAKTPIVSSPSYEDYLGNLSTSERSKVRRAKKLLDSDGMRKSIVLDFLHATCEDSGMEREKNLEQAFIPGSAVSDVIERALRQTTQKYYFAEPYHAQSQILWAIASGCILVQNNSVAGVATQGLVYHPEDGGCFHNGFFVCKSMGNSHYLKAFLLDCLINTIWTEKHKGTSYYTSGNANSYEIFSDPTVTSMYNRYKHQLADSYATVGLVSSIDSSEPQDFAIKPPYYDLHTKRWVLTMEDAPILILKGSDEESTDDNPK